MNSSCLCSENAKPKFCFLDLDKVIEKYKGQSGSLIPVLHEAQDIFGYLPKEVQIYIGEGLGIPISEVYGVVSFYSLFTTVPRGKYVINVCLGTACYVKGAGKIVEKIKEELEINIGETTEDGLFTLEGCRCIGACGLAPVLTINDEVYGRLTEDEISGLLHLYRVKENKNN